MRYMTCKEFKEIVKYKFGYNIDEVYLNDDGSIYGANIGNCFMDSDELTVKTGLILDHFRIINTHNLKIWKDLYGKKEENN